MIKVESERRKKRKIKAKKRKVQLLEHDPMNH